MTYWERKEQVRSYLGKTVRIEMDRPIGTEHPKHPGLLYPINYGYIPGVLGGDGEELDVYLLGVDHPVKEYTCRIIAIAHRENDEEDKLVAAPEGMIFDQAEIESAVHFQEKYYKTNIEAIYQRSCGGVIFRRIGDRKEYLLLLQRDSGTWSIPKGHAQYTETEEETALREINEEAGVSISFIQGFREVINYSIGGIKEKKLVIFASEVSCDTVVSVNRDEIKEFGWFSEEEATRRLYPEYRSVIAKIEML